MKNSPQKYLSFAILFFQKHFVFTIFDNYKIFSFFKIDPRSSKFVETPFYSYLGQRGAKPLCPFYKSFFSEGPIK
jgi:hypothetical protein